MSLKRSHELVKDDEWMTPKKAWADIKSLIPKQRLIWEAFYGDGSSGDNLRELGFDVIHENVDFFTHNLGDIIVTNPPFSKKKEIFQRLKELDKPFILIVPTTAIQTLYFKEAFGNSADLQLIFPSRKMQFIKKGMERQQNNCCFYSCYVFFKMNLKQSIMVI